MVNCALILTVISDDKPGIVELLSQAIAKHQGSWQKCRMSYMAGKFAGILVISLPTAQQEPLSKSLAQLAEHGLTVTVEKAGQEKPEQLSHKYILNLTSNDRPGIIKDVSQILAERHVNLLDLTADSSSAPMSGAPLFQANALVEVPNNVDIDDLTQSLEDIAHDLIIDFSPSDPA